MALLPVRDPARATDCRWCLLWLSLRGSAKNEPMTASRSHPELAGEPAGQKGAAELRALLAPQARLLRRASVLSVLSALIWPLQAAAAAFAISVVLETGRAGLQQALIAVAGFAVLGFGRVALNWLAEGQAFRAATQILGDLRGGLIRHEAAHTGSSAFGGPAAVAALAGEKLALLVPFVTRYAPARARVMIMPGLILLLALPLSWSVALVFAITGPLIPVFMALIGYAARSASERQLSEMGTLNDLLSERLAALCDIRLLGAGDRVAGDFATRAGDLRGRTMAVLRIAFLSSTVLELLAAIGVAMVAVLVGFALLGQLGWGMWGGLSPMAGIFLLLLAPEFYQPLRDLSAAWHDRAAALALTGEISAWRAAPAPVLPGQGERVAPLPGPASVALRGCATPSGQLLPDILVAPGEKLALVGPSGSGKTSALRLMAGLMASPAGQVEVAGERLSDRNADAWRARLGWMPQSVHFLDTSIAGNVVLGREGSLAAALDLARIGSVIGELPGGVASRPGETGGGLSGGEARRLTLARAVFGAPDLILADEPTANLDAATAAAVTQGLLEAAAGGAGLVVATHDTALAARMDRVIHLGAARSGAAAGQVTGGTEGARNE